MDSRDSSDSGLRTRFSTDCGPGTSNNSDSGLRTRDNSAGDPGTRCSTYARVTASVSLLEPALPRLRFSTVMARSVWLKISFAFTFLPQVMPLLVPLK